MVVVQPTFKLTQLFFLLILIAFLLHPFHVSSTDVFSDDGEIDDLSDIQVSSAEESSGDSERDDLSDIEELIAIDEQEEALTQSGSSTSTSEAKVVSRAQRIVIELNHDNAQKIVKENEFVLLLGYTPWCPRSAELMPHFAEAANRLKELGSPVVMAKLDAERFPKAASSLEIRGSPTMLLFSNGSSHDYSGGFTAEDIVIWARKKTGEPVIRLYSVAEADEFAKKCNNFVLGLLDKFEGPLYEEYAKAASSDNEIQFVATTSFDASKLLFPDIKPASNQFLGLVKSEPEKYTAFEGPFDKDSILQFLDLNKFPLVTRLTELNSARIYANPTDFQVYLFLDIDAYNTLIEPLREVAKKFKSKIMFLYVDIKEDELAKPLLNLLGLEDSEDTVVAAFDSQITSKYLLESEPTPKNIEEFCSSLLAGVLQQHLKSQPIPDNKDVNVKMVVGKTFDEVVLNSPDNILLEVHTPWCLECRSTSKQVEKLAKHYKDLKNLIFARIDASVNEHPQLQVEDYPTLLFYPASDKSNPIKMSTKSGLKDVAIFINKSVKATEQNKGRDEL